MRSDACIDTVVILEFFRTYSPQGDGNSIGGSFTGKGADLFFRTYSPQGDGNIGTIGLSQATWEMFFRTYSPQGDGNISV